MKIERNFDFMKMKSWKPSYHLSSVDVLDRNEWKNKKYTKNLFTMKYFSVVNTIILPSFPLRSTRAFYLLKLEEKSNFFALLFLYLY